MFRRDHPTDRDFEHFLGRPADPNFGESNARVVRHLLAECSSCRQRLLDMCPDWRAASYDYSRAFAEAQQALDAFFAKGKIADVTPEELWTQLASLPQQERERWVITYRRFANPRLVQKLIEMSKAARFESPTRMLHLANLAVLAADACTVAVDDNNL